MPTALQRLHGSFPHIQQWRGKVDSIFRKVDMVMGTFPNSRNSSRPYSHTKIQFHHHQAHPRISSPSDHRLLPVSTCKKSFEPSLQSTAVISFCAVSRSPSANPHHFRQLTAPTVPLAPRLVTPGYSHLLSCFNNNLSVSITRRKHALSLPTITILKPTTLAFEPVPNILPCHAITSLSPPLPLPRRRPCSHA